MDRLFDLSRVNPLTDRLLWNATMAAAMADGGLLLASYMDGRVIATAAYY